MIFHKFNAVRTEVDGISFPSKKQARYWQELQLAKKSGQLLFALREAPFHLPGGVRYVVDFIEFWADGTVKFVDVKGMITPIYKAKKKMVEALYPIQITEA